MSDCSDWLDELTHSAQIVLDEDLAALEKLPERSRIERYEEIKSNEEELLWEFSKECSEFVTDAELDHLRGQLRLARLLLAASFYDDGELPAELQGDFIEAELQAVVEFDRYKQFDVLDEDQIEERIRRMEGEVYELVTEYTSTQIANIDELVDNPDVQQDVIEELVDRYDERRERIRQGFFVYVETHGMEHMVEAIEDAVKAVSEAAEERERVRAELEGGLEELAAELETRFQHEQREFEAEVRSLEQGLASRTVDSESLSEQLAVVREQQAGVSQAQVSAVEELDAQIERTGELETQLERKIEELEDVRREAQNAEREAARNEAADLVETELEKLHDERADLQAEIERLRSEREQIETTSERLDERRNELEDRVERLESSFEGATEPGLDGEEIVTASIARLLEMDYLGRFDTTMHEASTVHTPDGPFDVPEGYWEERSQRWSERPNVNEMLEEDADPYQYPTNQTARYEVTSSSYLGLASETEMVVEAVVHSHVEAYATNGFDTQPADLDDLLELVNEAVYEAEEGGHSYLLAIASPTGWTDRVRQQVATDRLARTHYSRHVSVCLVDLQDGEVIYDESDPLIAENVDLFEPAVDAENVNSCVAILREEYVADVACDNVLLEEVVDGHGFDSHIVKRAFNQLESEAVGEQLYVDDVGLALYFD